MTKKIKKRCCHCTRDNNTVFSFCPWCREVRRKAMREHRKTSGYKKWLRKYVKSQKRKKIERAANQRNAFKKYGLTVEDYNAMSRKQKEVCALCGKPESVKNRRLSVDHDHANNKNRALLCTACNRLVGLCEWFIRHDRPIFKALKYIKNWSKKHERLGS